MESRSYLGQLPRLSESSRLQDLYALNRQFVSLLLAGSPDPARAALLEPCVVASLCALPDPQLDRLATCPYSLFDLRFADAGAWQALRQDDYEAAVHKPRRMQGQGLRTAFTLSALMFARQLADAYPDLARLLLGMHNDVARSVAGLSLPALAGIACDHPAWLRARLARHPHFWPDLIDFVREGTRERYLAAKTLGVQQSASGL